MDRLLRHCGSLAVRHAFRVRRWARARAGARSHSWSHFCSISRLAVRNGWVSRKCVKPVTVTTANLFCGPC